jgi:hypothetical protein
VFRGTREARDHADLSFPPWEEERERQREGARRAERRIEEIGHRAAVFLSLFSSISLSRAGAFSTPARARCYRSSGGTHFELRDLLVGKVGHFEGKKKRKKEKKVDG